MKTLGKLTLGLLAIPAALLVLILFAVIGCLILLPGFGWYIVSGDDAAIDWFDSWADGAMDWIEGPHIWWRW